MLTNWRHELGRDPAAIDLTVAIDDGEIDQLDDFVAAGAEHLIIGLGAPFDMAALKRMVAWRDARG